MIASASLSAADINTALTFTPVNKAGDTMVGALAMGAFDITNTGNITMAANKYLGLSANSTNGTVAGQMWYDAGTIKYYDGSTTKSLGVAGAGITSLNGLSAGTQSFVLGTAGTDIGISSAGSAHTFDIPTASATKRGALSSADWSTFNSKMSNSLTSANIWVGNSGNAATAVSMSGDATISNAGVVTVDKTTTAQANKILALDGSSVAVTKGNQLNGATSGSLTLMPAAVTTNYSLTFPGAQGASGQVLSNNGSGVLSWATAMTNSLTSANIWVGNSGNAATAVSMSGDATMSNAGVVTLANSGVTAGTYAKVSVDAKGRVIASASLSAADVNTALTYTPVNKAGDTMVGALAMGGNDLTNAGNITMAANKYLGLSANSTNGTVAGQMWYDSGTIKYYDGSTTKSLGVAGAGITSLNGLSAGTQSFVLGTAGTDIGISSAGSAHTFDIPTASSTKRGALSSADWSTFNSKMSNSLTSANIWVGNSGNAATAVSMSGDATISNAGVVTVDKTTTAQANKILALDGSSVAVTKGNQLNGATSGSLTLMPAAVTTNYSLTFPGAQGASGQVLSNNGSGVLSWATAMTNSLTSANIWVGNSGNAATAVSMSGDATMSNAGVVTLANSGVTAGTYAKVSVDAKGRVIASASLSAADINTALTYTPVNKAGDTMVGALAMGAFDITNTGNITMAANKYLGLSANSTNGTVAGQMWYDAGTIKYYDGSTTKSLGVAGAGITSLNGLSAGTQSFVLGTAGTDIGISSAGSAHTFDIPTASATKRGALSSADWSTFNSKMSNSLTSANIWVGNSGNAATAVSMSGDATMSNAGVVTVDKTTTAQANKILALDGSSVAVTKGNQLNGATSGSLTLMPAAVTTNYSLTFPGAQGASGQVLSNNGSGVLSWATAMTNSLTSANIWVGNSGNAATAVSMSGDATMSNAGVVTLANSGVTAGTYAKVSVDAKGRVIASASLSAADVNTALTYTPVNKAGDTMAGALAMGAFDITNTGNITMAANKYLGLSANSTNGTVAGQMWYDSGTIKYYDGSTTKSLGVAGAGITSLNGLSAGTQSFVLGTAGTDIGISSAGSAHTFDIPTASATKRGALSSADWSTFNSKMSNSLASTQVWVGNASGVAGAVALSGDISSITNAGVVTANKTTTAQSNKLLSLDGSGVAATMGNQLNGATSGSLTLMPAAVTTNYSLTFPGAQGASGQVLSNNGAGVLSWASAMTNSLTSANIWVGNSGNAATAVSMSGDATMSNAGVVTLANSGVTAGTYAKVSVDAKGRVIASASLSAADINTALTYTPVNKAGDTMAGALAMGTNNITNTGNITMAANKYFTLSANTTNGTTAGQMWYDTGTIKYYDGSVVKSLGVAGAGITSLNGLSTSTQSFVLGTAGTDIGISSAGSAHTFDIPTASATKRGALSSADWSTFNSKMSNALTSANIWVGNSGNAATAVSMSGDATMSNAGVVTVDKTTTAQANKILALDGSSVAVTKGNQLNGATSGSLTLMPAAVTTNYSLTFPGAQGLRDKFSRTMAREFFLGLVP
ncbi:MAG: hypothetical protein IPM97_04880 [Bdellovibrionaceae bacterium]|nr:hypothetical protein [Pseudobdellovibrionaceae bacterium]